MLDEIIRIEENLLNERDETSKLSFEIIKVEERN